MRPISVRPLAIYSTKDFPDRKTNFMEKYGSYLERPGWNTLWLGAHQSELFQSKGRVLSLLLKPTVIDNHNFPDVYMVVNMKEGAMRSILEQDLMNNQVQLFLLQKDGSMVIRPETQTYDFNTEQNFVSRSNAGAAGDFNYINAKGEELLVNYSTLSMNEDWVMVSIQSKADLLKPLNQIRWLIFWIMLICTLVALALSNLLASALLKPLNKLQRLMVEVEYNDLDVRFQSRYEDEVSAVGHKFNRMLDQIQVLIQEVRTSEQEKRKSEVKALQAQVDPHFLYNTLNTIFWKSENGEKSDVSEMIVALSLLFRLGLNNGNDITTLQQEVQHVRQYLQLQQKCYENLFTYTIEVEDDAYLSVRMLKILLQPLVENSILHGFRDKAELGRIEIRIYRAAGFMILRVTDNGCGMDAAQLANAVNGTEAERRGYALSNLRSRLSLHYGESASIAFSSIPDIATTVTVTIPIL
ncbi:sensor histidine kinase [Paenibacillus rhizoplanae]|uniref:sensor histidine kinase n=1 Tax=Paenibacillus rhizoplanae TaxID=1917181 RepID=UPI003619B7C8